MNWCLRWVNRGSKIQSWQINNGDEFVLQPNYARPVQIRIDNNYTYQISVDVDEPFRNTAASLTYIAATNTWTINSVTPREWALEYGNDIVTVRCFLSS